MLLSRTKSMQQSRVVTFVLVLTILLACLAAVALLQRGHQKQQVRASTPLRGAARARVASGTAPGVDNWDASVVSPAFFGYTKPGGVRASPEQAAAPPAAAPPQAPQPPPQPPQPPQPTPAAPVPPKPAMPELPPAGSMPARADPELPGLYKLLPPAMPIEPIPPMLKPVPLAPPGGKTITPMPATHRFSFNSAMRNTVEWPSPSRYRLDLPAVVRNVVQVTLFKLGMPLSEYIINEYNKWIDVKVGGTVYSVAMEERNVDATNFATVINAALAQLAGFGINLTCTATVGVNNTGKLSFSSNTGPFEFLFKSGPHVNSDAWMIFGFDRVDTPSSTVGPPYVLAAPNRYDITGPFAIMLFIDELTRFIETADGAVAHINTTRYIPGSEILFYAPSDVGAPTDRQMFIPIGKLQYLTFNFVVPYPFMEPDGNIIPRYRPYLFNGRNHSLHFCFACREYMNPSTMFMELDTQE